MLGSIFIGLSGMNAYTKGLQIISNNVANLNTLGFKSSSVLFSDLYNPGGTGGLTYLGSNFAAAGGNGVKLGETLTNLAQGELRQTGNDLDLSIQGEGYLVLLNNGSTFYARTGQFAVDKDGYISDQVTGYRLAVLDASGQPVAVNVDAKRSNAPVATTKVVFDGNLNFSSSPATVSNISVYDSRGGSQLWNAKFTASATTAGAWDVEVTDSNGAVKGTGTISFIGNAIDPTASQITITDTPAGADPLSVVLDFSAGVTSYSGNETLQAKSSDGNTAGTLSTVTIDENGQVKLTYSNKQTALAGAVAIADFRSPQLLERSGNGLYRYTGSGEMRYRASAQDGVGTLTPKEVEASNVNLADEFGNLILVQRGFQACSQVVSVSNDMIQQLFGIRGQA
jgi:flagellar hook protein FlgE